MRREHLAASASDSVNPASQNEAGFTLIEALVAMMIVAMVVISFIGIRTSALIDATYARNWRLAREIAEQKMSELQAGARELPPESGVTVPIEDYEGFSYKIVIGEANVANVESEVGTAAAGENTQASERLEWQRHREDYRRASSRGLTATEYEEQLSQDDVNRRLAENAPSATEFEEVAVVVFFPKLEPDYPDQKDALVIKTRMSTLAISGMTPEQAQSIANVKGQASPAGQSGSGGSESGGGNSGSIPGAR